MTTPISSNIKYLSYYSIEVNIMEKGSGYPYHLPLDLIIDFAAHFPYLQYYYSLMMKT